MNRDCIEGAWKQLRGALKEQWGRLTHDQAAVEAGREERLHGSAQLRHGISKHAADRQLRDFMRRNRDWNNSSR